MKKNDIKKDTKRLLIISIIASIGFVVGIPAIIFGAIYGGAYIILMVVGIILTVIGFYGSPILWVNYAEKVRQCSIYEMITVDGITDINTIASSTGIINAKRVEETINILIQKRYLTGYKIVNSELSEAVPTNKVVNKCPNCGANMTKENGKWVCKYCNSELDK